MEFLSNWLKFLFVLTPFFGLTMFLSMTKGYEKGRRRRLVIVVSVAVIILCFLLFFFGNHIFSLFGITLDSFRIGAGVLLFLSGLELIHGKTGKIVTPSEGNIAVVPLAIPIIVGPATTGTLMVMGAELEGFSAKIPGFLALLLAIACVSILLFLSSLVQRILGEWGIGILTKLTGLILVAMASQMVMKGIIGFLPG